MGRPMLQLALDVVTLEDALRIAELTKPWVDWIEAGTPLIVSQGLRAVRALRLHFPHTILVADTKIADAAHTLATLSLQAGADILTVLSSADDQTIGTCVEIAHAHGRKVLCDHISRNASNEDVTHIAELSVDYAGLHLPRAADASVQMIIATAKSSPIPMVVAGGINLERLQKLRGTPLAAVVVGGAVIGADNPSLEAQRIAEVLQAWDNA